MSSEKEVEELSKPEIWDNRYAEHLASPDSNNSSAEQAMPSFEWFRDYNKLRAFFQKWLPRPGGEEVVLHLGYGNSVVINAMMTKYAALGTRWSVMDVRKLDFQDTSIDDVRENVGAYVDQVARVLKPGGRWLYITYRQPHFIKPLLLREDKWSLEVETLVDPDGAGGFEYLGFVMTRHGNPP
ncbi:hypothetical protein DL98DRAFT_544838 [Cadophora sp. DSE1049]|nr:hypothetical protein DL98DRAFT_544838 [Cadophora sp. DSE1049]